MRCGPPRHLSKRFAKTHAPPELPISARRAPIKHQSILDETVDGASRARVARARRRLQRRARRGPEAAEASARPRVNARLRAHDLPAVVELGRDDGVDELVEGDAAVLVVVEQPAIGHFALARAIIREVCAGGLRDAWEGAVPREAA